MIVWCYTANKLHINKPLGYLQWLDAMRIYYISNFFKQQDKRKTDISCGNSSVYEVFALQKQFAYGEIA